MIFQWIVFSIHLKWYKNESILTHRSRFNYVATSVSLHEILQIQMKNKRPTKIICWIKSVDRENRKKNNKTNVTSLLVNAYFMHLWIKTKWNDIKIYLLLNVCWYHSVVVWYRKHRNERQSSHEESNENKASVNSKPKKKRI